MNLNVAFAGKVNLLKVVDCNPFRNFIFYYYQKNHFLMDRFCYLFSSICWGWLRVLGSAQTGQLTMVVFQKENLITILEA